MTFGSISSEAGDEQNEMKDARQDDDNGGNLAFALPCCRHVNGNYQKINFDEEILNFAVLKILIEVVRSSLNGCLLLQPNFIETHSNRGKCNLYIVVFF